MAIKLQVPLGPITSVESLGQYLDSVYKFALGIVGIVSVVMIMIGGIIWITSAGNASKVEKAKDYIFTAIVGLLLLLGSYGILRLINPQLTNVGIDVSQVELPREASQQGAARQRAALLQQDVQDLQTLRGRTDISYTSAETRRLNQLTALQNRTTDEMEALIRDRDRLTNPQSTTEAEQQQIERDDLQRRITLLQNNLRLLQEEELAIRREAAARPPTTTP